MQAHARVYCANKEVRNTVVARAGRSGNEHQELDIHLGEPRNTAIKLPVEPLNYAPGYTGTSAGVLDKRPQLRASCWNHENLWTSIRAPKVCGDGLGMLARALFCANR